MAFLNFLGDGGNPLAMLLQGVGGDYSGAGGPLQMAGQVDPSLTADLPAGIAAKAVAPKQRGLGFRNVLGMLGDSILQAHGRQPIYGPMHEKQQIQGALQNFLTDPDGAIQQLMQVDAPTAIQLYRMVHPANETPAALKEWDAYQKLPSDQQAAFLRFRQSMSPQIMSPITMGPNDTYEAPGQAGGEVTATNPQTGEKVRWNGRAWEPIGGAQASPAPTFP